MNVTGTRTEIIISTSGMAHAPKRNALTGAYLRRFGWRVTACGQIAEHGWSQGRRFGYIECRTCLRMLEDRKGGATTDLNRQRPSS